MGDLPILVWVHMAITVLGVLALSIVLIRYSCRSMITRTPLQEVLEKILNREIKGSKTTYEIIKDKFVKRVHIVHPEETPEQRL